MGNGNGPFFLKRLHGAAFGDAGEAWDDAFKRNDLKRAVGAEASLDMTVGYFLPTTLRVGLYKALDDQRDKTEVACLWATF